MRFLLAFLVLALCGSAHAEPTEMALWPEGLKIATPVLTGPEHVEEVKPGVGGRPWLKVENVARPTMTIYPPARDANGTAVVVFPGGGYRVLAIDLEGTEICDWLTAKGVTCVVLKYRVPGSGPHWNDACRCHKEVTVPMALQDAQRALGLLRENAQALHIDPHRIGVIGFSAGGHMVADVSNRFERRAYRPVDAAEQQSSRPDFAIALYPGHLWDGPGPKLHPRNKISAKAPPTFILQAENDPVDNVRNSIVYFLALQEKGVPAELHIYPEGGHAFGLRSPSLPIGAWPQLVEKWMASIGMLPH
ncbi:MAG: alpha/beta hydrolase [Telluria sp.]